MFYYINPIIELIAFIITIYCLRKSVDWYYYFIWFMLVVVVTENAGFYIYFHLHQLNHWLYNLYLPIEALFKFWIVYKICTPHFNSKPAVYTGVSIFTIVYLIESIQSGFTAYSSISNNVLSIWLIVMCLIYFYYLISHETENLSIYQHAPFWIMAGLFFFYFVSTASNLFFDYLIEINKKSYKPIRYSIFLILDFILYASWSYAFICKHKYKEAISSYQ